MSGLSQTLAGKLLKGLYSAAITFLASLGAVLVDGATFTDVTAGQWVLIAGAALGAFGGTFGLAGWAGPSHLAEAPPKDPNG